MDHASQCEVTRTPTRAGINKPILWSVTATDEGHSLSRPVLATVHPSSCQVCATSPAKASSTLNNFASSFHEMVYQKQTHAGSDVARNNKIRADLFTLRQSAKSMLGDRRKKRDVALNVAEWNVRTLMDRSASQRPERQTALVAMEMDRYGIDVAALSETRLPGYDSLEDHGYVFFWSGKSAGERREAGVGFALRKELAATLNEDPKPVNDRIMTMRLPLQKKLCATFISVYAPTLTNTEEVKEQFYSDLRDTIKRVPADDRLILIGDFNARIGSDSEKWKGVLGSQGVGKCNANGELLLALCSEYSLVITNTIFKHKEAHKNTWMHPRSKHWHLLDYIIVRQRDVGEVLDTRALRGADCGTDHVMLRSKLAIKRKIQHKKSGSKPPRKLDTGALKDQNKREQLKKDMDVKLEHWDSTDGDMEQRWEDLKETVYSTASQVLGKQGRKHQDWFDEHDMSLQKLIEERDKARQASFQCNTRSKRKTYRKAQSSLQRYTREMKSRWWEEKARELQEAADRRDMKAFYTGLRETYGPKPRGLVQLRDLDGTTVLQEKDKILERFSHHFDQLLNIPGDLDERAKNKIMQRPAVQLLDDLPDMNELVSAIGSMQDRKAPGRDGIPSEVWKHGGQKMTECLLKLIQKVWDTEKVPQDWKDASIVPLFKKGDRKDCGNYRGISLLSIVGKILSRILLNRLNAHITPGVLPESQCGFRSGRSTIDMVFCLKQVQEKCTEQNMPLYVVFVDFSKAFDTVSRVGLWQVLQKFGCTAKFISIIEALHTGMQANVAMSGSVSSDFAVSNGVKQGCVLAPTLFSLYLSAMLEVAFKDSSEGVYIQTRKEADLFNVAHFKSRNRTTTKLVRDLLFADDSALVAHDSDDIQTLVDRFADAARMFSLKINIKKTECLYQPPKFLSDVSLPSNVYINGEPLEQCKTFKYLGSTVADNAKLDNEISLRIGNASAVYGNLRERLWNNRHVSIKVKCQVYRATVLAALLYGAETWTVYSVQTDRLQAYVMRHLRSIMGISWRDKITNVEVLKRAGLPSLKSILIQMNLRWLGHVERMDHNRLPRQLLYSQLKEGRRNQGRPRLRFKDTVKRNMKKLDMDRAKWQKNARNRDGWRCLIRPK